MYNPRKINLYLENELPTKKIKQKGGFIDYTLINNSKNKYLRADRNVETIIHGTPRIETDVELWFQFNNEVMNNDDKYENLYYTERSNNSISFSIDFLKKYSNVSVKDMPKHNLSLKLIEFSYKDIDTFINEWKENKILFEHNIHDIYMYGDLYTSDNTYICNYIITKKYKNHTQLLKIDYEYTIKYIIKMLIFIEKCRENNIILRNFKFSGIGYEFINSEIEFVLLDYNDLSLIKKTDDYFNKFKNGCDNLCAGTLVPYFVINDYFEMNPEWLNKLDKLYSVGLAEILIFLLFNQDQYMENLLKLLYNPSQLKPCLHYHHYMKLFQNKKQSEEFRQLLNGLTTKFIDIEPKVIKPMFMRLIYNCFEMNYENVKSPLTYLNHMNEIYADYNKVKSRIKTYIRPIESESLPVMPTITKTKEVLEFPKKNLEVTKEKIKLYEPRTESEVDEDVFIQNKIKKDKQLLKKDEHFNEDKESDTSQDSNTFQESDISQDSEVLEEDEILEKNNKIIEERNKVFQEDDIYNDYGRKGEDDLSDLEEILDEDELINFNQKPIKQEPKPILKRQEKINPLYKKVSFTE